MLWGAWPGKIDNAKGLELSGSSGKLLWEALSEVGLTRGHFDVQNAGVRCWPADDGQERDPTKRELQCCAVYNSEALDLNRGEAVVHVILGDIAGEQLLGKALKKDHPVFWHEPWNAYCVYLQHPSYLLRRGEAAGWEFNVWKEKLRAVATILKNPGRWGYIKSRRYEAVESVETFDAMEKIIKAEAKAGRRVSYDVEDGTVNGKKVMLLAGFGVGKFRVIGNWKTWTGRAWSVVIDHPEASSDLKTRESLRRRLKLLLEDVSIPKTLQNGSYDSAASAIYLGAKLRGYDYDTMYGTFLRHSFLRSCGLENLTYLFFPEFGDYKDTVIEHAGGDGTFGSVNYANVPLDLLVLRNCGDCDVTKRLEERFSPQVNQALAKVYVRAGMTLDKMERRGPILDWENWKKASEAVPKMIAELDRHLRQLADDPGFECDSSQQVAHLLYDVLKLPTPTDRRGTVTRGTGKEILELLLAETGDPVLELVMKRRTIGKIASTYLAGYARSAELHDGELRTIWWLVGAVTGRLRSGKGDRAEAEGILNFQNTHGNPMMQNLMVSDRRWRLALEEK
jgi:uracil-DNA glycosylase family 4